MADQQISTKRIAISKANAQMVGVVAGAAFVTVFCLFAAKTVWSQNGYQARVISQKQAALNQLKKNLVTFTDLKRHYGAFNETATNVLGGTNSGTGDNDGNNSKIILDALPSKYDFPALTSSLEKILTDNGLKIGSITGTDDQLNQQNSVTSSNPQAVPMPFTFSISGANYGSVQDLINKLEHSVRPIQVDTLQISGGQDNMTITVTAHTFYQAGKDVSITKKVVK
jgi:hypothetical protein